jgi:hypothetical protein
VQTPLFVFCQEIDIKATAENVSWTRKRIQLYGLLWQRLHTGRRFTKQVFFVEMPTYARGRLIGEQDVQHVQQ